MNGGTAVGQFDQTARPLCKLDGGSFVAWALACCAPRPPLTFDGWDDTRRLVRPGEPDRTNDLVALVRDEARPGGQAWLIAEIEEEAEPGVFYRMGDYELRLGREVNPTCDPDGPAVASLVVNLTGAQPAARLEWAWGGHGTRIAPFVVDVAAQDAVATLERIERGEVGLTVLPFLALMKGGGTPEFVGRWKRAVEAEPDEGRRLMYRDAALTFVDLKPWSVNWLRGTEGWMERTSKYIESWERRGEERAEVRLRRAFLLEVIGTKVQGPVPETIRLAVEGTNDPAILASWVTSALAANTLVEIRRAMKLDP